MTKRQKNLLWLSGLCALFLVLYARILFTGRIIRAPDISNEYFWYALDLSKGTVSGHLNSVLNACFSHAGWNLLENSGTSVGGGTNTMQFLGFRDIIYSLIPLPTSIAWYIVAHLLFGAIGTFMCCQVIGAGFLASFVGALIFAAAPENTSLINAGHVMKIVTISFAPWAFYFLERGFQTRRQIFFLTTGFMLAIQFFNIHWQIAFYTCLCVGAYGLFRLIGIRFAGGDDGKKQLPRLLGMNVVLVLFFLSTVSMSLLPLANWSKDTNRGVQSGTTMAGSTGIKGGLDVDEAMSWSLPPEELGAFIIPGFFGLSRQEGGANPSNIVSYYWGRMRFTQTVSYMGLIPWLLVPLPLIFRRDRYTWLPLGGIVGGVLFSMGKYTPFYWLLFKYFPGINHFRVPKMMMFIPVLGLAILAARGIDLLQDEEIRKMKAFARYLIGVAALPILLLFLLGTELIGAEHWINMFQEMLSQPTRYEQGAQLIGQRWNNLIWETAIAAGLAALSAGALWMVRKPNLAKAAPWLVLLLFVGDTWRINDKFLFLTDPPVRAKEGNAPPLMNFLKSAPKTFRVLPMDGSDPMQYVSRGIPVMFTSNAVQQMRWQQFLDSFALAGSMPDILNIKYLIYANQEYQQQKIQLGERYMPVYTTPDGAKVVLENRTVLPKGWLVPSVAVITDPVQRLGLLQHPQFNPATVALVESPPPVPLVAPNDAVTPLTAQNVSVPVYEGEHIVVEATTPVNALLVLGEKYYTGWQATVDGKKTEIVPVDHILRGVYLTPGAHKVEFRFDPLPFKIGKYLTLASFAFFAGMLVREWLFCRRRRGMAG